jgi:hypothetical protein
VLTTRPDAEVLVVAHGGLDELTSPGAVWKALPVDRTPMRVRWWQVPHDELPRAEHDVEPWLTGQWQRVSDWVDARSHPA